MLLWYKQSIPARWATYRLESNYITEALPKEWEFWTPCHVPQPGSLALGEDSLEHWILKASGAWVEELHRTGEKQRLHSWRVHTGFHVHWVPGQSRDFIKIWVITTCGYWKIFWQSRGWLWLAVWVGHWRQRSQGITGWAPLEAAILENLALPIRAEKLQAKQQTRWKYSPTHQQIVHPGTQLPVITGRDKATPTRQTRLSYPYQWAGTSLSH